MTAPSISTAPAGVPSRQREPDAYKGFLKRAAARILMTGGSEADVLSYLERTERIKLGQQVQFIEEPPMWRGVSMKAAQGLTFGFADEAVGGLLGALASDPMDLLSAIGQSGGNFAAIGANMAAVPGVQQGVQQFRGEEQAFTQANPKTALAAEVGGGLLAGGMGGARAAGANIGRTAGKQIMRTGVSGAAQGALAGAGNAEGGPAERLAGAGVGGVLGAPLGAGMSASGKLIGAAMRPAARALITNKDLQKALPGAATAEDQARLLMVRAMARDGVDVTAALTKARRMQGAPATPLELAGENTRALFDAANGFARNAKEPAAEALLTRQAGQGARMVNDLADRLKLGIRNIWDAEEMIIARRKAASDPLYQRAFQRTVTTTERMQRLLAQPRFRDAYNIGRQIAEEEDLAAIGGLQSRGLRVPALPEGDDLTELPVRALDYMKRGLDLVIENAGKEGRAPLDRQHARALRSLLNEVLEEADGQVPEYKAARALYRGDSDVLDALRQAEDNFLKMPPRDVKKLMDGFATDGEREMFRTGAVIALSRAIHGQTAEAPNVARRFFGGYVYGPGADKSALQRIQALFPSEAEGQAFADRIHAEAVISHSIERHGGARMGRLGASTTELAQEAAPVLQAGSRGIILGMANAVKQRGAAGWTEDVADELVRLFTKGANGPQELDAFLLTLPRVVTEAGRRAVVGAAARTATVQQAAKLSQP